MKQQKEYYIGLDMGTSSLGWAVTDTEYQLLRAKGKDLWGVRTFEEAQTSIEKRTNRVSRRRRQREKARIGLLKELFADAVLQKDPGFYHRLEESKFLKEDRSDDNHQPYALFADEEAKICTNVKALIKAVRRNLEDTEPSRYMIAAISDNAAYIASRLAPENVIVLSSDGITLSETAEQIESITDKMDSLIILAISNHFDAAKTFISSKVAEFRDRLSKYKNDESLDTLIMLFVVDDFIKHFLGVSLLDNEDMIQLLPSIDDKDNHKMSAD